MADPITFRARSLHTFAPDRIYRVDIRQGAVYFLRVGGEFNLERASEVNEYTILAYALLGVGELLFRKHRREELLACDPHTDPEGLLTIHLHNFKLYPADVEHALLLPPRWYACLRLHFGRLALTLADGTKWHSTSSASKTCGRRLLTSEESSEIGWKPRRPGTNGRNGL